VVPPPTYGIWVASIYAIETSLVFAVLSLVGLLLALLVRRGRRRAGTVLAGTCVLTLLATAMPTALAVRDAVGRGVTLSPVEYVGGLVSSTSRVPQTVTYASVGGVDLRLDVWRPDGVGSRPRSAVVVVHGGGWEAGQRSGYPRWNAWLVEQGYAVFDIDYRLAPPPRWRDAVGDVKCAVGWVRAHASTYDVDPARIGLLGRSAGGHLALLAAYTPGDDRLSPSCAGAGNATADTSVASVVALYPPADLAYTYAVGPSWSHPPATTQAGRRFLRGFTGGTPEQVPDAYQLASPINHVRAGVPPTMLVQGGWDRLKTPADTARLATRVRASGSRCDLVELAYADHAFDANWAGWGSQLLRPALAAFLNSTLGA
jgi:acetyl esterase/lipase